MADLQNDTGAVGFFTQADALLRKNLTYQKRNCGSLIKLFLFPIIFFILMGYAQTKANQRLKKAVTPAIHNPPEVPPLLQVPKPEYRAVKTDFIPFEDLPDSSCFANASCPATILFTGLNKLTTLAVGGGVINTFPLNTSFPDINYTLADFVFGSDLDPRSYPGTGAVADGAFSIPDYPLYRIENKRDGAALQQATNLLQRGVMGVEVVPLWRDSSPQINDEIYKGYRSGNSEGKINEIMIAYDLLNTSKNNFNVRIWYNSSFVTREGVDLMGRGFPALRVPRTVNLITNSYLKHVVGPDTRIPFEFVKEMPKPETRASMDLSMLLGSILFLYMILLLFPLMLTALVYEKQEKLRIIMKMHGLSDGTYWTVTYAYNFVISLIYIWIFCTMGDLFGFNMFRLTAVSIQCVFLIIYINLQISLAFLLAAIFSNVKTASVVGFILVFASGLLSLIFQTCIQDPLFPRQWITILELYPGLSLSRGLSEMAEYADEGQFKGSMGMQWGDLSDKDNGMREVLIIMVIEWFVSLFAAYYIDQVVAAGGGVRRSPLFFLNKFKKKPQSPIRNPSSPRLGSKVVLQIEKADVAQEREKIEQLLLEPDPGYTIVCDNLKKVYPGRDGNPDKYAVKGLSLALPRGECFGMLGPNGAGKSSFLSMMMGLTEPSSGTAYVHGLDLRTDMNEIYTSMGVCPQHDLLWETLTGREHLLFYGRLKNLKGSALTQAVEESLDSVNLLRGGVADKQAGKYSGGMKRRLSVAISLIGDPKVVYMDEPSTALDPASRNLLWNVVKRAKRDRAIILTTHSMEEAEYLCDRLGIFVSGSLQCVGSPNELKGRYGGSYVFTVTTSANHDKDIEALVRDLAPGAARTYHIPGTQKFELPKNEVKIVDVFRAVDDAKKRFTIQAWGLADTTLEDVFIKVALEAQESTTN